jgi:hypothetical protein
MTLAEKRGLLTPENRAAARRAAIDEKYPAAPNVMGVVVSGGDLQHQSASTRLSRAGTGFGAMLAAGSGVRVTSEVAALFAAMSARAGATFRSFNRARTSGVRLG